MSRRTDYPAGVPCFVDTLTSDVDAARRFYGGVFGWEFAGPGALPGDPAGDYFVARVEGDDVAGVGSVRDADPAPAGWNTHVAVESADAAAERAVSAGGAVLVEPFDAPPAGRMAVIADPAGATLCLWQAGERAGAGRINEASAWAMSVLRTTDPEGAVRFYGELFGWQAELFDPGAGLWLWRLAGYVGGEPHQPVPRDVVAAILAGEDEPASWTVDFWAADADAAADAAPQLGGAVVVAPFSDAMFRRAVLAAPDGATFTVSQLLPVR